MTLLGTLVGCTGVVILGLLVVIALRGRTRIEPRRRPVEWCIDYAEAVVVVVAPAVVWRVAIDSPASFLDGVILGKAAGEMVIVPDISYWLRHRNAAR